MRVCVVVCLRCALHAPSHGAAEALPRQAVDNMSGGVGWTHVRPSWCVYWRRWSAHFALAIPALFFYILFVKCKFRSGRFAFWPINFHIRKKGEPSKPPPCTTQAHTQKGKPGRGKDFTRANCDRAVPGSYLCALLFWLHAWAI